MGKLLGLNILILVSASQRVGNNLSGDIPENFFQVQQEFGHPTMRLDNLVVEEQLLDGRLDVVAGRIKATDDFAYSWVACYSQNLGSEGAPVLLVLINGRGPAEPWIDMDHLCPAFSALDHPLEPHRLFSATFDPMISMASALLRSCSAVVAPPRPNEVPRPGTVELCHMRAWLLTQTIPRPAVKSFLIR